MGSASGIHEGKEEEAPQVPVEQVGPAEGLAEQVGPAHERVNGERPTWGNAAPTPGSEDDDDDYLDWQGYGEFQREAYNRLVGYDKVKRGITKRSEQLTALRKDHFNILEREHARVEEARNALKKVVDEQFREGRHLRDVFSTQALILQKQRDIISKQFYLEKMARDHEQDEANLLFHLEEHRIKAQILDNQYTAEQFGVPLGPEPEAALKRRREVRDAFFSLKAPEAKRAKVALSEELPCDLPHAPGHTHTEINQFLSLRVTGHTHEELDKLFAKFGCNLLQVRIDGEDQQAQGLP